MEPVQRSYRTLIRLNRTSAAAGAGARVRVAGSHKGRLHNWRPDDQ